jgi:hypothetical protein
MIGFIDTLHTQHGTIGNTALFLIYTLHSSPSDTHWGSQSSLVVSLQQIYNIYNMKSSFHSLIPFFPLFCNCQFRRLYSVQFLCSQAHFPGGWRPEIRLNLLNWTLLYNNFARITQKTQRIRKLHTFWDPWLYSVTTDASSVLHNALQKKTKYLILMLYVNNAFTQTQSLLYKITGAFSPEVKGPGRYADHSSPNNEVNNARRFPPLSHASSMM